MVYAKALVRYTVSLCRYLCRVLSYRQKGLELHQQVHCRESVEFDVESHSHGGVSAEEALNKLLQDGIYRRQLA